MLELIRTSSLHGFSELVISFGGDPVELLAASRIDAHVLGDSDAYIAYSAVVEVLERAAAGLECPDFGLRLALCQGLDILGPVALVARHAKTVDQGVQDLSRYLHVYSPAIRITLEPCSPTVTRYRCLKLASGLPVRAQMEELGLGVALRAFQLLIGDSFRPLLVAVPHAAVSSPARYRDFFDAEVAFEQSWCGFEIRTGDLARPVDGNDVLVRDLAIRYLTNADPGLVDTPDAALKATVARMLPTGQCTIEAVARLLAVHPRTLQRQLAESNSTFTQLVTGVRRDAASRYLRETTIPISQIADLLGYSEQSALTRACRGWFGVSPRAVRSTGPATAPAPRPRPARQR